MNKLHTDMRLTGIVAFWLFVCFLCVVVLGLVGEVRLVLVVWVFCYSDFVKVYKYF